MQPGPGAQLLGALAGLRVAMWTSFPGRTWHFTASPWPWLMPSSRRTGIEDEQDEGS